MVDIKCEIYSEYKDYVTRDNREVRQLLLRCQNALYGKIVSSLLSYFKFAKSLTSIGFEINPYNPCVANKVIEGSQLTMCFHIDDCKLSYRDRKANDIMIKWLLQEYESIFEDGSGKISVS